jgi:hypothetical protein
MKRCFHLLAFGVMQFLNLPEANKENDKKLETNIPLVQRNNLGHSRKSEGVKRTFGILRILSPHDRLSGP